MDWQVLLEAVIVAVLVTSGAAKWAVPTPFAVALQATLRVRSVATSRILSKVVAVGEVVTAFGFLFLPTARTSSVATAALGGAIILFAAIALIRRVNVACGCFGASEGARLGWRNVAYGLGFTVAGVSLTIIPLSSTGQSNELQLAYIALIASVLALGNRVIRSRRVLVMLFRRGFGRNQ